MKNSLRTIFAVSLITIAVSCSSEKPRMQRPPAAVMVQEVIEKDAPVYLETIGNIHAFQAVEVKTQVNGQILAAHVEEGQKVKVGDLLFTLDRSIYAAEVEKAKATLAKDEASLAFAKTKVEHYKTLADQEYISKLNFKELLSQVEIAEAQVGIDKAELARAEINLERTSLYSPIDGRVSLFKHQPGNLVSVNDADSLTEIRQTSPIDVHFSFPQKDFHELRCCQNRKHLHFEVLLPHQKSKGIIGKVYFIDNHIDLTTGTILLKGKILNEKEFLWPGQFVRIRVFLKAIPKATLVPIEAIQMGQKGEYVYVVKEDMTAEMRPIVKGSQIDNFYIVEEGVQKGDKVVITGQLNLQPGSAVRLIEPKGEGL